MDSNYAPVNNLKLSYEADSFIKSFLSRHNSVLSCGFFSDDDISIMKESLTDLYNILFSKFHQTSFVLGYLRTLLYYVLTIPTELNVEKQFVSTLYDKLNIIDDITFYISQVTPDVFSGDIINKYLTHIENTESYIRNGMFLSRVNKAAVLRNIHLDINDVSLNELYYGISTGYFYFCEWNSEAYDRLCELVGYLGEIKQSDFIDSVNDFISTDDYNPISIIAKLKQDGFLTSISRFVSIIE